MPGSVQEGNTIKKGQDGVNVFPLSMEVLIGQWLDCQDRVPLSPLKKYMVAIQEGRTTCQSVMDYHREVATKNVAGSFERSGGVSGGGSFVADKVSVAMGGLGGL